MHHEGGNARRLDLDTLGAFVIGVKDKGAIRARALDVFQQHHAGIGQSGGIDGGQCHGAGIVRFGLFSLGQPTARDGKRVVPGKDSTAIRHSHTITDT